MKKIIIAAGITLALSACTNTDNKSLTTKTPPLETDTPKNIIMIVGDGMGPAYTTAYRYFNDDPTTTSIEQTVFDRTLVGMSSTYPARVSGFVTDSAASATALATGVKSYNGAISVDVNKKPIETVLERARNLGKKTGIVVTSQVNHATPASYLTHNESRKNYNAIADSYLDNGIKANLILGGGWKYFIRKDRHLVNEFKAAGFYYIDNYHALKELPKNKAILGLFADKGLPWALDDKNSFRLSAMTKAATKQLENEQGYFMLIEASQVDWAGHANDIAAAMTEMADLAKTLEYLEKYVQKRPDTLVVLTADHSTGGFTIGANGKYSWNPKILRSMTQSPEKIAKQLSTQTITTSLVSKLLNFDVTNAEATLLQDAKNNALRQLKKKSKQGETRQKNNSKVSGAIVIALKKLIDQRTNTGWTSVGHTAIDVPVFAFGKSSEMFQGKIDNTDVAKTLFKLLEHDKRLN